MVEEPRTSDCALSPKGTPAEDDAEFTKGQKTGRSAVSMSSRQAMPTDPELTAAVVTPRPTQNQVHKTQAGEGTVHETPTLPQELLADAGC